MAVTCLRLLRSIRLIVTYGSEGQSRTYRACRGLRTCDAYHAHNTHISINAYDDG